MKKKTTVSIIILTMMIGMSVGQFLPDIFNINSVSATEPIEIYHESFDEMIPQPNWDFANVDHWRRSSIQTKDGTHALRGVYDADGRNLDGVQFHKTFADGSIEAWIYPEGNIFLTSAIWLRTSTMNPTEGTTFEDGYLLRIYNNEAHIQRSIDHSRTTLDTISIPLMKNKWWHLKFEAEGDMLQGWISETDSFSVTPNLAYNIFNDDTKFYLGKPGISGRTTIDGCSTYFDDATITIYEDCISEGFEDALHPPGWEFARDYNWGRTLSVDTSSFNDGLRVLKANYGTGLGITYDAALYKHKFKDGSIEGWFQPEDNSATPALWIRSSKLSTSIDPSVERGYLLQLTEQSAEIQRCDYISRTTLYTHNLGENIQNKWWHLKIQAIGSEIQCWVTRNIEFSEAPQFSYDTINNGIRYYKGKAGFSATTNLVGHHTFIDDLVIRVINPEDFHNPQVVFNSEFDDGLFINPIKNPLFSYWRGSVLDGGWTSNSDYTISADSLNGDYSVKALGSAGDYFTLEQTISDPNCLYQFKGRTVLFSFCFKKQESEGLTERARGGISYKVDGAWTTITGSYIYSNSVDNIDKEWLKVTCKANLPESVTDIKVQIKAKDDSGDSFDTAIDFCTLGFACFNSYEIETYFEHDPDLLFTKASSIVGFEFHQMVKEGDNQQICLDLTATLVTDIKNKDSSFSGIDKHKMMSTFIPEDGDYGPEDDSLSVVEIKDFHQTNNLEKNCINSNDRTFSNIALGVTLQALTIILGTACTGAVGAFVVGALEIGLAFASPWIGFSEYSYLVDDTDENHDGIAYSDFDFYDVRDHTSHPPDFVETTTKMKIYFDKNAQSQYDFVFQNELHTFGYSVYIDGEKTGVYDTRYCAAYMNSNLSIKNNNGIWDLIF